MSNTKNSENSDEIDLGQLAQLLGRFFKKILLGIFQLIHFFKKKAFLLIGVVAIGSIGGVVWDHYAANKSYVQEIIIEPNLNSTVFLYDFIEQFNQKLEQGDFGKDEPFEEAQLEKIEAIVIEPVVDYTDILNFYKDLDSNDSSYDILEDLGSNMIRNKKYISQFRFHKIRFHFDMEITDNKEFSEPFFTYIKSNKYFIETQKIKHDDLSEKIKEDEKSILFINNYVEKISENKLNNLDKDVVVLGNEDEIPTVASLIKQKNNLIDKIAKNKEELQMNLALFNIVRSGDILEEKILLNSKKKLVPLTLLGCLLMFFLFKFLYKKSERFLTD